MHDTLTADHLAPGQKVGVCGYLGGYTDATVVATVRHTNDLGGRWATVTLDLPGGERTDIDSRGHVFITPEYHRRDWCPECCTMREVTEESDEGRMTPAGETTYRVVRLECDHATQGPERVTAPAPGAPYVGPGVAVAASSRPRDVRAARRRQAELDHPYGPEHDQ